MALRSRPAPQLPRRKNKKNHKKRSRRKHDDEKRSHYLLFTYAGHVGCFYSGNSPGESRLVQRESQYRDGGRSLLWRLYGCPITGGLFKEHLWHSSICRRDLFLLLRFSVS